MKNRSFPAVKFFTLLELLIVVAIIMILAGMLLPALRSAREKAKQIQCSSNMKQCGLAICAYASDFNGFACLYLYKNPGGNYQKGGSARWLEMLNGTWDVEYLKSKEVVLCPSCPPATYEGTGFTYGARAAFPANSAEVLPAGYTRATMVNLAKLSQPSLYLMLGDSYNFAYLKQVYILKPSTDFCFQLRHTKQGNILSADIHVESADRNKAKNWGITDGYVGTNLITF